MMKIKLQTRCGCEKFYSYCYESLLPPHIDQTLYPSLKSNPDIFEVRRFSYQGPDPTDFKNTVIYREE